MKPMEQPVFTALEIDAIGEIMNISLGSSATSLSSMLDREVTVTALEVKILTGEELDITRFEPAFGAEVNHTSGIEGKSVMVLKRSDIKAIIDMLAGTETAYDDFQPDDMSMSAAAEFINHMMSTASVALGEFLGTAVDTSTLSLIHI